MSLLSRHSRPLQVHDEVGYQVEARYSPSLFDSFTLNYSRSSRHNGEAPFWEVYGEGRYVLGDILTSVVASAWSRDVPIGREDKGAIERVTVAFDETLRLRDGYSLLGIYELERTNDLFEGVTYTQLFSIGLSLAPTFTITFDGERVSQRDPEAGRDIWLSGSLGVRIAENHDISLTLGSRRARFICSSGICSFEPELRGSELVAISRF